MMFMMLGHVTEVLGGDTWQNLVTSKLFKPIGMNSSRFIAEPDDTEAPHVARPYIYRDGEFQNGTKIIYEYVLSCILHVSENSYFSLAIFRTFC